MMIGGQAGCGPAWTRGEIEAPAGEKNMGSWTAAVYTEEQQARLRVTEMGEKLDAAGNVLPGRGTPFTVGPPAAPAAADSAPATAANQFPEHWGEPPAMQTKDLRELPGGYGMGSGTLAAWITEKMSADAATASAGQPEPKAAWPELVGADGEAAVATIKAERPDLAQVMTFEEGGMMTMDWREDRVRVFVNGAGQVSTPPACG